MYDRARSIKPYRDVSCSMNYQKFISVIACLTCYICKLHLATPFPGRLSLLKYS